MLTCKWKKPDKLGYGSGKQIKTTSDLDNNLSDPDNNSDPNVSLDAKWTFPSKYDSNDKPGIEESNEDKRKDDLRVNSITMKALKEQYRKLSSKQ